eukprot:s2_g10.t1
MAIAGWAPGVRTFDKVNEKPAGFSWPTDETLPNYFSSLDVQLSMFAAPLLDDARASAYQSFSQVNVSTAWQLGYADCSIS